MTTQLQTKNTDSLEIWEKANVPSEIWTAMKSSLYPGVKDESVLMAWSYCKAANLDPLQKPVHLVPMWIVDKNSGTGAMRDVVMPGIGLYRIQASRSGMYAGMTEPEFGPNITERLGTMEVTYPEWCKITVKKIVNGQIVEFTAKEYWIENYANSGKDKVTRQPNETPNEMWRKRKFGQLAKCTEAQALRKAFPDHVSQAPTAEEMEGKTIEGDVRDVTRGIASDKTYASTTEKLIANLGAAKQVPIPEDAQMSTDIETTAEVIIEPVASLAEQLTMLIGDKAVPIEVMQKWLTKSGVKTLAEMSDEDLTKCIAFVHEKY
jgi:phage recombination protein Bet